MAKKQVFQDPKVDFRAGFDALACENGGSLHPSLWYVEYNMELGTYKQVNLPHFIRIQDCRGEIFPNKPKNTLSEGLAISFELTL